MIILHFFPFSTTQIEQLVEGLIGIGDKNGDKRITFDEYVHMSHDVFVNNFAPRNLRRVFRNYWSLNAQFIQGPLKIRTEHHFYMIFQLRGKNGDLNCIPGFDFWTTTLFFLLEVGHWVAQTWPFFDKLPKLYIPEITNVGLLKQSQNKTRFLICYVLT